MMKERGTGEETKTSTKAMLWNTIPEILVACYHHLAWQLLPWMNSVKGKTKIRSKAKQSTHIPPHSEALDNQEHEYGTGNRNKKINWIKKQ